MYDSPTGRTDRNRRAEYYAPKKSGCESPESAHRDSLERQTEQTYPMSTILR